MRFDLRYISTSLYVLLKMQTWRILKRKIQGKDYLNYVQHFPSV